MAKGVKLGGGIDTKYWEKAVNNAKTNTDARQVLYDLFNAATAGIFNIGITDNDQKNIMSIVNKLGKKFDVDVTGIASIWDPSKNHLSGGDQDKARNQGLTAWDNAVKNKKPSTTTKSKAEAFYESGKQGPVPEDWYTTDTKGNKIADTRKKTTTNTSTTKAPSTSGGSKSSKSYGSSGGSKGTDKYYDNIIKNLQNEIDALKNPKVWTADELAEHYGVTDQYNYDNILKMYNDATNQYYDDAVAEQTKINEDSNLANTTYANNLIREYINSYANQAPTAVRKGTVAANALATGINANQSLSDTATQLNNLVTNYQQAREAELAANPTNARSDYNNMGSWLLSKGAEVNKTEVQKYIDDLNAYNIRYTAARQAQSQLANARQQAYQSNLQAALANAAANAQMRDYPFYQYWYGDNAPTAYWNLKLNTDNNTSNTQNNY